MEYVMPKYQHKDKTTFPVINDITLPKIDEHFFNSTDMARKQ